MRACLRLLIIAALLVFAVPAPAFADGEGGAGTDTDAYLDDQGNPTVEVVDEDTEPGSNSGGDGTDCYFRRVASPTTGPWGSTTSTAPGCTPRPGAGSSWSATGASFRSTVRASSPRAAPSTPSNSLPRREQSVAIDDPPIETSPDADQETYAQVTTWLWVEPSWWQPYSATASAGRVSATVTATPVLATWSTGDGGTEECAGPGVVWRRGLDDGDTYCSHVYRDSSAGQPGSTYPLTVTVTFEVTWTSNVGQGRLRAGSVAFGRPSHRGRRDPGSRNGVGIAMAQTTLDRARGNGATSIADAPKVDAPAARRGRIPELAVGVVLMVGLRPRQLSCGICSTTSKEPVLALAADVERGEVIDAADLRVVYLASDDPIAHLSESASAMVVGRIATDGPRGRHAPDLEPGRRPEVARRRRWRGRPRPRPRPVPRLRATPGRPGQRRRPSSGATTEDGGPEDAVIATGGEVFAVEDLGDQGRQFISLRMSGRLMPTGSQAAAERGPVRLVLVGS